MKITLTSILFAFAITASGQTEKLNQPDSAGKKDGKWIRYLDKYWNAVEDSTKAVYYRYTFYDHGLNVHPMGRGGSKDMKLESTTDTSKQIGKIKILDGEYKWFDKNGKLIYIHVLKNGEYVAYKEFDKSGVLRTFFDYTKKCENQPHSWCMFVYDKKGILVMTSFICKDKEGRWPPMRG